jgi:hypothetical protein
MRSQKAFDREAQLGVLAAMIGEIGGPICRRHLGGGEKQVANEPGIGWHGLRPSGLPYKA